jgi:hypothetical protein
MVEEIQRHQSVFPKEDPWGPWDNYPQERTWARPQLPPNFMPEGRPGHGPGDIARYYPRSGGDYELPGGKMIADSRGRMMDPEGFVTEGWQGTPRPVQKTHWWPTHLGKKYDAETYNEMMGVNVSGYPEDELGGFTPFDHLNKLNPYGGETPWEETGFDIHGMGTGETSEFFPPLTLGDLPTSEFGEEIIEEDNGSWDIWDFIQRFFPGGVGAKGIGTLLGNQ